MADQQNGLVLWHQCGVNPKGEPFVQLILNEKIIAQMTVEEARDHGHAIIEAAEAAETDAFVMHWVTKIVGAGFEQALGLLADFRKFREETTGKRAGAQSPTDWHFDKKGPDAPVQ